MSGGAEPADTLDMAVLHQLVADLDAETAAGLVAAFVDEMMARSERISQAAAAGNAEALAHEVHALKSSAGTYGAQEVADLAGLVEACCRDGDLSGAARLVPELPPRVGRAAEAFAAWRESLGLRGG